MIEKTFIGLNDGRYCEMFIDYDGEIPIRVYGYRDNLPEIPGVSWEPGRNPVFRHASNPEMAAEFVQDRFNLTGED